MATAALRAQQSNPAVGWCHSERSEESFTTTNEIPLPANSVRLPVCQTARLPPCHTSLPHAITSPYPVSMNPTRNAIRKLPTLSNVHTPALPCLLARLPTISTAPRRISSSTNIVDSMAIGFVFAYFDKKLPVLALLVDITSETIRRKTTPSTTPTIRALFPTDHGHFRHPASSPRATSPCPPASLPVCPPARADWQSVITVNIILSASQTSVSQTE